STPKRIFAAPSSSHPFMRDEVATWNDLNSTSGLPVIRSKWSSIVRRDTMAERKPAKKSTRKAAKSTTVTGKKLVEGFTDEERAAMRERVQELKAGPSAGKADGESAVLAKIAAMPAPDRAMGERLHAIIKASAPTLSPKTWYGMPAYAKDGQVICF